MLEGELDSPLPSMATTMTWCEEKAPLLSANVRVVLMRPP